MQQQQQQQQALKQELAPALVDSDGLRWVRTEISRGSDLVDGTAWIAEFKKRLTTAAAAPASVAPARRRLLRQVATDGDCPQYWGSTVDPPLPLRNEVLKQMSPELCFGPGADTSRGPGKKVRLVTGEEVIFWFNVGQPGQPRERVYVTNARCPHQGVCLNTGELKDIEDVAGVKRGMVRCPRHNKTFDLKTGESPGNAERLPIYPCRFEHGHWYVAVGSSLSYPPLAAASSADTASLADEELCDEEGLPLVGTSAETSPTCTTGRDGSEKENMETETDEPMYKKLRGDLEEVRPLSMHASIG